MDTFYSAGGRETVSSTNLRMMWDQKNLYLYLICYEKEARVSRPSDENVLKTEWMLRKDKIEIALSSGNFGARDYAVFCADTEKQAGARTEKGMTYFGGDKAILNDYFTEKNDAVKTEIPSWKYTCKIAVEKTVGVSCLEFHGSCSVDFRKNILSFRFTGKRIRPVKFWL